jgi:hypothetical protein
VSGRLGVSPEGVRHLLVKADALVEALDRLAAMQGFNQASEGARRAMKDVERARIEYRAACAAWEARHG